MLALLLALPLAVPRPAAADAPQVATDIPPVHSLVARVMQGVGAPGLVLPPGASPHGYSMRPSEARTLAGADIVIWTGDALTPWLARAIGALAPGAATVELLDIEGTTLLGFREGAAFEHNARAEAHAEGQAPVPAEIDGAHAGHAHEGVDPHAWLDPQNAQAWLDTIAATLARADPENAETYRLNAAAARDELDALTAELSATLAPVRQKPFIVFHDAYHYFEDRFGLDAAGAISLGDASAPSPARIAAVRATLAATGAPCVFAEPQFAPDLIETVTEGTEARAAVLDPLGITLAPGPDLYPALLRNLAAALRDCLGP
jgi:zinc transport system substrate-binding protein